MASYGYKVMAAQLSFAVMGIMEVEVVALKRVPQKRRGSVFFLCSCYLFFSIKREKGSRAMDRWPGFWTATGPGERSPIAQLVRAPH